MVTYDIKAKRPNTMTFHFRDGKKITDSGERWTGSFSDEGRVEYFEVCNLGSEIFMVDVRISASSSKNSIVS